MTSHFDLYDSRWLRYIPATLHSSPLYLHLSTCLKDDPALCDVLRHVDPDQPLLILFFSVVNFLLLRDHTHDLAQFYPYLSLSPRPAAEAYPSFRDFCVSHLDEIRSLLVGARLQTNEVTRCANLLPAFELVSLLEQRQPLALIEIGASAGLNLNWHRYGYQYDGHFVGERQSPVQIQCALQGYHLPLLPATFPAIASCQGIEVVPRDIHNEADIRWLRACIWPEEMERYHLFDAALSVARQYPPRIHAGDACDLLPALLKSIPLEQAVVIWHSFALNQGPKVVKERIEQILIAVSTTRPLYRISLEVDTEQGGRPRLEVFHYHQGGLFYQEWLATCAIHGEQMEWHVPIRS